MKQETKKELLVRKNQFIQKILSERSRLGLRIFFSLPRSLQLKLTKGVIKKGVKNKWEELGQS